MRVPFITKKGEWLGVLNIEPIKEVSIPVLYERDSRVFVYSCTRKEDGAVPCVPSMDNIYIMTFRRESVRLTDATSYIYLEV